MMSKTLIVALASLATVATAASPAMAHGWARHHPRQAEVLGREHHQIHRINQERREGELTGQQAQEARLAVTVSPHDADAGTVVDAERDRLEDDPGRVLQVYGLGPQ